MPDSQAAQHAIDQRADAREDGRIEGAYGRVERAALVAAAIIMLGIVAASAWLSINNETRLGDAAATQEIRARTVDLLEAVTSAETGQRGYLLTGKDFYLNPYRQAAAQAPKLLAELGRAMRSDPTFPRLKEAVEEKLAELDKTVALTQQGRREEALEIVESDRGQTIMDAIRLVSAGLTERQRQALTQDLSATQHGARTVVAIDSVALVLLALLTIFVTSSVNRNVSNLRRARSALEKSNAALAQANAALQEGRDSLELAVRDRTAELTLANEEIQRFAYIVSHDLRAPLLNIIGFTSELETATATLNNFVHAQADAGGTAVPADVRAASEEDLPEAIRFIQTSTAKMDRLINAILRLSREGRRVLVPERLDMSALLRACADTVRHQAAEAEAEIVVGEVPAIVSDRIAVDQVFSNLIDNALKYLADGRPGRIEVQGRRQGGMAVVSVRDNGRGIAARDQDRIFELFRRAGVQNRPGEGIGLAHVKALVRRLGGTIECDSILGEGSVFTVRLPLVLSHGGAEPARDGADNTNRQRA
jgi:signal transduction histidine kinase